MTTNLIRTCELHDEVVAKKRAELQREHPTTDAQALSAMIFYWLHLPLDEQYDPAFFRHRFLIAGEPASDEEQLLLEQRIASSRASPTTAKPWLALLAELEEARETS